MYNILEANYYFLFNFWASFAHRIADECGIISFNYDDYPLFFGGLIEQSKNQLLWIHSRLVEMLVVGTNL